MEERKNEWKRHSFQIVFRRTSEKVHVFLTWEIKRTYVRTLTYVQLRSVNGGEERKGGEEERSDIHLRICFSPMYVKSTYVLYVRNLRTGTYKSVTFETLIPKQLLHFFRNFLPILEASFQENQRKGRTGRRKRGRKRRRRGRRRRKRKRVICRIFVTLFLGYI